uniref:sushi, von Willebrand factor type A, EGF and pentraxin domain-containing protein 1 isoform X2 n=1 Tax=Ciona intestinalis TaxID=7719 RepID=UPI00089DB133|nr:sushi, von Willebrand factor type A, EGF and pentraxin domain-containing protein 1 isoform X2 [Ciona intestinalis]|eukprot:XP_018670177.1 sushi, von Willebrand factor type A, EGF and pentraxin domain-containing protein 1 isoform X2 [Ciona intestinalis]
MLRVLLLFFIGAAVSIDLVAGQACPPRSANPGRACKKQCTHDAECRGALKTCQCDNVCGMSCFNPNLVCDDPGPFPNGQISPERGYGQSITYTCNVGYNLKFNSRRTCQSNKQWSGVQPRCDPGCITPPATETAFADSFDGFYDINQAVNYICRIGHRMTGRASVRCGIGGVWSPIRFQCTIKICGEPPGLINGGYEGDDFTYGRRIRYFCNRGYILRGEGDSLVCDLDERWFGNVPTCDIVRCNPPVAPLHGSINLAGVRFQYNQRVPYSCDQGYKVVGSRFGVCNENGTWGDLPTCEIDTDCKFEGAVRPTCGYQNLGVAWTRILSHSVPDGSVGFILRSGFGAGRQQSSSQLLSPRIPRDSLLCIKFYYYVREMPSDLNFILVEVDSEGRRTTLWTAHTLDQKNQWLSTDIVFPRSNRQTQIEFKVTQSAWASVSVDLDDISVESNVPCVNECANTPCQNEGTCFNRINGYFCFCQRGFRRHNCSEEIVCQARVAPRHGTMSIAAPVRLDAFVVFQCDQGYYMRGESRAQCLGDNRWNYAVPTCNRKTCNSLVIADGTVSPRRETYNYGSSISFTCSHGYRISHSRSLRCVDTNRWSSAPPTCRRITCPPPHAVRNATTSPEKQTWYYRDVVMYQCHAGYVIMGPQASQCLIDGTWTARPECNIVQCQARVVANGVAALEQDTWYFGDTVMFICNDGYKIIGNPSAICLASTEWSKPKPVCIKSRCDHRELPNGVVSPNTTIWPIGSIANYSCSEGFVIDGPNTSLCSREGMWSNELPSCSGISCPAQNTSDINIIQSSNKDEWQSGEVVAYSCPPGFAIQGNNESECFPDGHWSHLPPQCTRVECNAPEVANGRSNSNDETFVYEDSLTITCDRGYNMVGDDVISCSATGQWSQLPVCEAVQCPDQVVGNSTKQPNNNVWQFNDVVNYACNVGYQLSGEASLTCTDTGMWSHPKPTCVEHNEWDEWSTWSKCKGRCNSVQERRQRTCRVPGRCPGTNIQRRSCSTTTMNFRGITYTMFENRKNFNNAKLHCESINGTLAMPKNADITEKITEMAQTKNNKVYRNQFYFGLHKQNLREPWLWVDGTRAGTPLSIRGGTRNNDLYHNWKGVEPNNARGDEFCGSLFASSGGWNDIYCDACLAFICEQRTRCTRPNLQHGVTTDMLAADSYDIGTVITGFQCTDNGAQLVGAHSIQCVDGTWNNTTPTCETRCPRPVAPANMESPVDLQDFYGVRALVRFLCVHEWDQETGNAAIECQHDGTWTENPMCVTRCQRPATPANMRPNGVLQDYYYVGNHVEFRCMDASDHLLASSMSCNRDRTWRGEPACVKRCGRPVFPTNMRTQAALLNSYQVGDRVTLECVHRSDALGGNAVIECQDNGAWTENPTCARRCSRPHNPVNMRPAVVLEDIYEVGDSVRFQCVHVSDRLVGNAAIVCQDDRTWTDNPTCVARCTLPDTPAQFRIEITNNQQELYEIGAVITFGCVDSNDEMSGPSQIRCQINRQWSRNVPSCLKRCQGPNPPDGLVLSSGENVQAFYSSGVTITFQCSNAKDEMQGLSSISCQGNGRWDRALPVCLKRCERSGTFYYVGNRTPPYSCPNADDLLQGSAVSTCLEDRTWSSGVPSCVPRCGTPALPDGVRISSANAGDIFFLDGDRISFQCINAHDVLVGENTLECTQDRTWDNSPPNCERKCSPPTIPQHGRLIAGTQLKAVYDINEQVTFECIEITSRMHGSNTITCNANRTWTAAPTCVERCPPILSITNGRVEQIRENNKEVTHVRFTCNPGYDVNGHSVVRCMLGNLWSDPSPTCDEKDPCVSGPCVNGECTKVDGIAFNCT